MTRSLGLTTRGLKTMLVAPSKFQKNLLGKTFLRPTFETTRHRFSMTSKIDSLSKHPFLTTTTRRRRGMNASKGLTKHQCRFLCSKEPPNKTEGNLWNPNPLNPPPSWKDLIYATLVASFLGGIANAGLKVILLIPSNGILDYVTYTAISYLPFFYMVNHTNATGKHWILCTWFLGPVLFIGGVFGASAIVVTYRTITEGGSPPKI